MRKSGVYLCRWCLHLFTGDPKRRLCPDCEFNLFVCDAIADGRVIDEPPPPSLDAYRERIYRAILRRSQQQLGGDR
jgi:hypothetical protein